jgi:very-short-patch-repair endonuclease
MERTCGTCGIHFQRPEAWVKRGGGRFCSRACYAADQRAHPHSGAGKAAPRTRVTVACQGCGTAFETGGSRPRSFCGSDCRRAHRTVSKTCPRCAGTFTVPRSNADRYTYCSAACSNAETVYRLCRACKQPFTARGPANWHCSEPCRRPPIEFECLTCSKRFRSQPATRRKFCSVRCYRKFTGETEPERNVRLGLETLGIPYAQEETVPGWRGPVDFILLGKVALEVDEPYWHARVADRDAAKTLHLQSRGYTVVRLTATPFYGPDVTPPMIDTLRQALAITKHAVPALNMASLHPLQLALPLHQEWVAGGGCDA